MRLHTPLCDLFGIRYPILQAGMGGVAGPRLVAAVSNAGGLGILGGHNAAPEEVRQGIEEVRRLTDRPFGVNLLLPEDLLHPAPVEQVQSVDEVQAALNPMRGQLGLAPKTGLPPTPAADLAEKIEIILDAKVPVFSVGMGDPGADLVARFHAQGTRVIAMAARKEDALALAASGVDAVVAQGGEGGGHRSHFKKLAPGEGAVGTIVLVPEVVDAVDCPVIAAGGIVDGRGLVAALALGAQGIMVGTRFIATQESSVVDAYKQAVIQARSDDTTVTDVASGRHARLIRNAFTESYGDGPVLPYGWQGNAVGDIFQRAREANRGDYLGLWAGQSAGRVDDLPSAAEVVDRIVREAEGVLARL